MSVGKGLLSELDELWYGKVHDALPSGELRAIGRFALGILKEMVKLSSMGYERVPSSSRGYILEKIISIARRAKIEDEILLEIMKYMSKEDRARLEIEVERITPIQSEI
ncbi:hypothetical protein J7L06_01760 [Candidatus Bathyarchaeota archaeon]|nr:hypothetical protein [Candidatus Bathyarchaeota archaeon]